jgi:anti-anti-sigma regulatory factor/PAS domain-containing protein
MADAASEASEDWALLQQVTEQLDAADTLAATLRALMVPAPAPDDAEACLWTIEPDEAGAPAWLTLAAVLPIAGQPTRLPVGLRHHLPDTAFARMFLAEPGEPVFIVSVADDPRVDVETRELWATLAVKSVLLLTLALRGRVVGMLAVHWSRGVALGPRDLRIYRALSRHAALLLDNRVLVDRLQASLADAHKQQRLLATVLDYVPVGILCIEAGTRRPLLTNRMARIQLAGDPSPVSEPLPIAHMLIPGTDTPLAESDLPGMRAARTGTMQKGDMDLVIAGGPRAHAEVLGAPIVGSDGKVDRVVVVITDVTERKQAVLERARLQDEVIRAQAAALRELSTPLIPISDDILVMPLIGAIDRERGQSILEVALSGARERRARVTILDITGVPAVDAQAAAALTSAARALRLLGVEPVLSGVRPEVAQALVELDVPLAGIVTCGSLQAGIAYAMRRPGKRP